MDWKSKNLNSIDNGLEPLIHPIDAREMGVIPMDSDYRTFWTIRNTLGPIVILRRPGLLEALAVEEVVKHGSN